MKEEIKKKIRQLKIFWSTVYVFFFAIQAYYFWLLGHYNPLWGTILFIAGCSYLGAYVYCAYLAMKSKLK